MTRPTGWMCAYLRHIRFALCKKWMEMRGGSSGRHIVIIILLASVCSCHCDTDSWMSPPKVADCLPLQVHSPHRSLLPGCIARKMTPTRSNVNRSRLRCLPVRWVRWLFFGTAPVIAAVSSFLRHTYKVILFHKSFAHNIHISFGSRVPYVPNMLELVADGGGLSESVWKVSVWFWFCLLGFFYCVFLAIKDA